MNQTMAGTSSAINAALQKTQAIINWYDNMAAKFQFAKATVDTATSPRCVPRKEIIEVAARIGYRMSGTFGKAVQTAHLTLVESLYEALNPPPGTEVVYEPLNAYVSVSKQLFENAEKFAKIGSQIEEKEGESIPEEDYRKTEEELVALHANNAELMKTIGMSYKNTNQGLESHFDNNLREMDLYSIIP